jgi:hypothetical protein
VRAALGLSPAPQAGAMPAYPPPRPMPAAQAAPPGGFGLPARKAPEASSDHVVSRMVSYSFDRYDIFTVRLENGQVWHQLDGDTNYARWKKPAGSYTVEIVRGFFGSYNLTVRGVAGMYKVKRIS